MSIVGVNYKTSNNDYPEIFSRYLENQMKISELAQQNLTANSDFFDSLLKDKNGLVFNQKLGAGQLYFNTLNPTPVAWQCPGYDKPSVPCLSNYQVQCAPQGIIRLGASALKEVPENVLQSLKLTPTSQDKNIDLFFLIFRVQGVCSPDHQGRIKNGHFAELNFVLHPWMFQHLHQLPKGHDVKGNPPMGIFPEYGVSQSNPNDKNVYPICINGLSPHEVIAHRHDDHEDVAFSPDNAQFLVDLDCPFQTFWGAAEFEGRKLICKALCISDPEGIGNALLSTMKNCLSLKTFLDRLDKDVIKEINGPLIPVIKAFENNEADALEKFLKLPKLHKNGCYKHTWIAKGKPINIHPDFGRCAFLGDKQIDGKFHSTNEQRAAILKTHRQELIDVLIMNQKHLLRAQNLVLSDSDKKIFQAARMACLVTDYQPIYEMLEAPEAISKVHGAIWAMRGSPQNIPDFGKGYFEKQATLLERAQAILLTLPRI